MQKKITPLPVLAAIATFALAALPTQPAEARNPFNRCINQLVGAGITPDKAGLACSDALIPKELSQCVARVKGNTALEAEEILQACYQVRRPIDLANCVIDINRAMGGTQAATTSEPGTTSAPTTTSFALESCRRSLLPGRHSQCVIAISRDVSGATPIEAMKTCLAAEDFPRDLFPAYVNN